MKAYLGVARANFLLLPVTLVAVGAAAAAYDGAFDLVATGAALLGLVALHAAVNAFNEYSDFRRGIDLETVRTPFTGGSGTLPAGHPARIALGVGIGGTVFGVIVGAYFLYAVGPILLPIYLLGALCVLGYTDFLARIYLGELFAGLGLGTLPVIGAAMVQGGELGPAAITASVPPFFMTFNLLLLNEFPDEAADRKGGRKNLVLLLGRHGAARLWALAVLLVPVSIAVGVAVGSLPPLALVACAATLLTVPGLRWAFRHPDARVPIPALARNVAWTLATNALLAGTLALATVLG